MSLHRMEEMFAAYSHVFGRHAHVAHLVTIFGILRFLLKLPHQKMALGIMHEMGQSDRSTKISRMKDVANLAVLHN